MTDREAIRHYLEKGPRTPIQRMKAFLKRNFTSTRSPVNSVESQAVVEKQSIPNVIDAYKGNNPVVNKIQHRFKSSPHPALKAALVHGSIASREEKPYSDFDGILIVDIGSLKTRVERQALRLLIRDTQRLMYEQDALQHHGWQVVFSDESSLQQENAIVQGVWSTCRIIYPESPFQFSVVPPGSQILRANFGRLTGSIDRKIHRKEKFSDQYFFKNLCSEILLLPAVFLQQYGHPDITKKESFKLIGDYFSEEELHPLLKASSWREQWVQPEINGVTKLFHLLKQSGFHASPLCPKTPHLILSQADEAWAAGVMKLIDLMERRSG